MLCLSDMNKETTYFYYTYLMAIDNRVNRPKRIYRVAQKSKPQSFVNILANY